MNTTLKVLLLLAMATLVNVDRGLALQLRFDDNVASNILIDDRKSLEGSFDIRPKLKGFRTSANERYFSGGRLNFAFTDDNDLEDLGYYQSRWERKLKGHTYHYERRNYNRLIDWYEMVEIKALGKTTYHDTDFYMREQKSDLPDVISYVEDFWGSYDAVFRDKLYTSTAGWGGDITYSMELNDYWLAKISTTGILPYKLRAYMGDIVLKSAFLVLDGANPTTPVPEPSTIILVGMSVGLIGSGKMIRKLSERHRTG